jgi:hypothetical protein
MIVVGTLQTFVRLTHTPHYLIIQYYHIIHANLTRKKTVIHFYFFQFNSDVSFHK